MEQNWYEVAVDALNPSNIISVVDWVSDGWSLPVQPSEVEPLPLQKPATYLVYNWTITDPSHGKRSLQTERNASTASPYGWHRTLVSNLPQGLADSGFADPSSPNLFQSTATVGNNVSPWFSQVI